MTGKLAIEFYGALSPMMCFVSEYADFTTNVKNITGWVSEIQLTVNAATNTTLFKVKMVNPAAPGLSLLTRYHIGLAAAKLSEWGVQLSFSEAV